MAHISVRGIVYWKWSSRVWLATAAEAGCWLNGFAVMKSRLKRLAMGWMGLENYKNRGAHSSDMLQFSSDRSKHRRAFFKFGYIPLVPRRCLPDYGQLQPAAETLRK